MTFFHEPQHMDALVLANQIYFHLLCVDTGRSLEDLPGAMNDRDRWREENQGNPCGLSILIIMIIQD